MCMNHRVLLCTEQLPLQAPPPHHLHHQSALQHMCSGRSLQQPHTHSMPADADGRADQSLSCYRASVICASVVVLKSSSSVLCMSLLLTAIRAHCSICVEVILSGSLTLIPRLQMQMGGLALSCQICRYSHYHDRCTSSVNAEWCQQGAPHLHCPQVQGGHVRPRSR